MGTITCTKLLARFSINFFFLGIFFSFFSFFSVMVIKFVQMKLIVVIYVLATILTTASASNPATEEDSTARWTGPQSCNLATYVRGFRTWQDDTYLDHKGLTKVALFCQVWGGSGIPKWIESGLPNIGRPTEPRFCSRRNQFVVGVRVVDGGPSLGKVELRLICDVPNWSTTEEAQRGEAKPAPEELSNPLPAFKWETHGERSGWVMGPEQRCKENQAVCGLNTKVDAHQGYMSDDSGIIEIRWGCCDFPPWTGWVMEIPPGTWGDSLLPPARVL